MRYTLFLYSEEANWAKMTPEQQQGAMAAFGGYIEALKQAGALIATDWLKPTATATTITLRGGRRIQDGPYADTKEQLGGFFVITAPDLDAAIAWAERCPVAQFGYIEIRPSNMPA
ncbi:MAG: YciI family protein [Bosea sp. (in: a-proteobacteria)]